MDGAKERTVALDATQMRHFDHGYAVTSHSSQGLTADRVLVNMDTKVHPELINTRFAYVSVSRASEDVRIYTNDAALLSERLSTDVTKTSAVDLQKAQVEPIHSQQTRAKEPPMNNSREHSQEELRRQTLTATTIHTPENLSTTADIEHRHNAPIQAALPKEASEYEWKRETGEVQSYQHNHAGSWLHIDPQGQFSSAGTMLQFKQPCQRKRQNTSGSARPARSRATSTTTREAGCTSTRKASSRAPAQCSNSSSPAKGSVRIRVEARDRRGPELPAQPRGKLAAHRPARPVLRPASAAEIGRASCSKPLENL